ncbi:magnesium and cobalt transport protein CorA [Streptomyces sp. RS10V-4]|uniref:magnesium and cobalt transport protein CorA n=1 Tax=Streptomyces rhizoryzae TaxID=2932493 RepID=UPI0020047195|nr:magnesium and cobalt transport protein CorA [Streptomyces rhizoryzae]MCK7625914.1 magnesium and cobalt transport protein CorA [Streptomyces rhizoryzae]
MECVIYQERTGEGEPIDCRQQDGGCQAALDRLAGLEQDEFAWIRMDQPRQEELHRLGAYLKLHPLAIEDAVQAHQRPKQERYGDVLAVAVKSLWVVEQTAEVETGEVMIFLGPSFALTVRHGADDPTAEAARRFSQQPEMARLGPVGVLHAVTDVIVDAYAEAAAQLRADLTELEQCVFSAAREDLTERIYSLKREVVEFRDAVQPLVPVMQPFTTARDDWPQQVLPYFRDVTDHLTRTDTEVRALDDLLVSVLDAHLAKVGTWQNDDMRRISAWAAILAIPTMVTGIYGMNFTHMPELDWRYGYPCALAVMALGAGLLYRAFRRNGWL